MKNVDKVKLPQPISSLLSGVSAVVSLYIVILAMNFSGFFPKITLDASALVLVFAAFFVGDTIYTKIRKPKFKKKDRRYPPSKKP